MKNLYLNLNINKSFNFYFLQIVLLFGGIMCSYAQVRVPFQQRTSAVSPERKIYNIKGDYTMIGNTNLTLVNYGDETSNANTMRYVDIDTDASTWNSSSSTLSFASENGSIPECSNIIYAGLYWTGRASDGANSPDIFDYTRTVNVNLPINQNYNVGHDDAITNTTYDMVVTRGGQTNNRFPIYTFSNGTSTYVFSYTNNTGANRVTLSINGGTAINIPVTVTGTTTLTATLNTPYQIVDGNVILRISSLVRSSSVTLSTTNTENTSFANVNVSGTIPGTETQTKTFDKRIVKIKGPNATTYTQVTANFDPLSGLYDIYYPQTSDGFMYSAYAEITDYVKTNGLGNYTLADLALIEGDGGGTGYYGGWGIIVVYENSKMNWRDVTIFDGHSYVAGSVTADFEIPVSGFNTVQAGPVNMKLGLMCGEGDRGISGDFFQIRNHSDSAWLTLNHSGNSANNFFNSSINTGGNPRNPNLLNNSGLDISMFSIPNAGNTVITNNQTATRFRYGSTQDTFVIFTVAMSVDAYIPEIPGVITTTQINNLPPSGPQPYNVLPGQEIEYSVSLYNTGSEASNNNVISIPIPYGSTYVPNSIVFNTNFSPAPSVSNAYFDPLAGANGSIIWNISEIPLPLDPSILLGSITYKLKATTDCAILTNPNCNPSIIIQGTTSGVGAISQVPFNQNFILGYTTTGVCVNEPISGNLVTNIDAVNYINQNCQNTQTQYVFTYCNVSNNIPVSQISGAFPTGTTFYNEFPVTTTSVQFNASNPFPGTLGTSTYYAVPPNSSGCFYIFDIVINNNLLVTQPANTGFNGCDISNVTNLTTLAYSNSPTTISISQFIAAGGTISNQSLINSISYFDVLSGTCSKIITRNFKIITKCNDTPEFNLVQLITFSDNIPPLISTLPAPSTVSCSETPVFATATASDACGSAVTLTFNDVTTNGQCAGSYSVTRTWTAVDACGNQSTASQTITVQDTVAPVISTLPAPSTVSCSETPVFATATASDACGSTVTLTFNDVTTNGQCAGSYSVTRIWTAVDACGNQSTASQTITVQDTVAPVISTLPAPSTVSCSETPVFATATASDACGSTVTLTFNDVTTNGQCAGSYSVTRTWTAVDACGNQSTASQTITVQDTVAPVISTLPAPSTVSCSETPVFATATASDACGSAVTLTFNDVTTNGQCAGSYSVTRTWTAVDACGNQSTASQTITVQDTVAPVISTLPAPSTVSCSETPVFATATASDACGSAVTLTFNDVTTNGQCAGSYSVTRTWTAVDACGNQSTASQTITVQDTVAPVISTLPAPSTVSCSETPVFATATASDACGSAVTLTFNDVTTNGQCAGSYSVTRTWTAVDACGNQSTASQTITVQDIVAPVISTLPAPSTVSCSETPVFATATASDACGSAVTLTFNDVTTNGQCAGSYSVTRTWTAVDACGNQSTASQTITVQDTVAPVISTLPAPSIVSCSETPVFATATASDACGSAVTLTFNDVTTNGQCAGSYSVTRTWTAVDACGNQSTASQTITVQDTVAPIISTLPAPSIVSCSETPVFATATASDACGSAVTLTFNDVTTNGQCAGSYSVTRTWTAVDACGNQSTASQTITVQDTVAPVISTLPAPSTVSCSETPVFATATASDACGSAVTLTFNDVTTNGQCAGSYSVTRTWTAVDACGNQSTASQTITVQDTVAPVISTLPAPSTVSCSETPVFATATASDACGSAVTLTFNDVTTNGQCAGSYSVTRTWTAVDACGNQSTASQTITVQDTVAPVISTLPAPSTVSCSETPVFATATASDACGSAVTLTFNDVTTNGQCAGSYSVTRTWTAVDACGNQSTASQTITVQDIVAPVISTLPAPSTVSCSETPVFATATASDACGSAVTLTFNDVTTNGQCAGSYSVTRTWTAVDACGNQSTASQTITVQDTVAPVISTLPAPSIVSCSETPVFATATASDACGSAVTLTFNDVTTNGQCAGSYSVTRTWTAVDACGNQSTASQTITVQDTVAPIISTLPAPSIVSCSETPVFATATASDACGSAVTLTFNDVTTNGQCAGSYSVTRTWTAVDACGNQSTASQTITVQDTVAPVISTLPAPSTVSCSETPVFATATASDACGSAVTLTFNDVTTNGQCAGSYSVTRTWTAVDACGNQSTASQTITVQDTVAPVISTLPAPSTVSCSETPVFATATASDACGSAVTLTFNDVTTNGQCAGSYSVTRTWTAVDACGNQSTASQTITVQDIVAPVISTLPAPSTVSCSETPVFATATASDACGSAVTLTFNDVTTNGQCAGSYSVTRTWTAVDACGNQSTASQTITVQDTVAPVISTLPAPSTVSCSETPVFATATASDACGSAVTLTFNDVTTNGQCAGSYSVTRTWTAVDACGNQSTASQTITVQDTVAPVISTLPAPSTVSCSETPVFATATASDACGSAVTLTFNDVTTNGQCAGSYSVTRTWTAVDACGNQSTASQTITVQDTVAPIISTLPAPSTVSCSETPVFATATASDACGSAVTLTFNDVTTNGQCAGSYSVTRTWTAVDACGNQSTASQTITVQDTVAPVISTLPAPSTVSCSETPVFATATASDACGSAVTLTFNDVTTNGQCAGSYSVTRTWTAVDACGNQSTASQTITVQDTVAPVISTLPAPSIVSCSETPVFATATASDACGSAVTLTFNDVTTNGQCAGSYSVTRTWTAVDACGNQSTASQTITVQDTVAPIISTLPAPSTVSCSETPVFATATASDACGSAVTLTFNDVTTNGQCAGSYSVTRTWTAVDACGNQSTASQTITVQDTVAPVISTLPAPSIVSCSETPVFATATASDACGSAVTLTFNDVTTNGQCAGSYSVTRTWTAVDACGNQSTASQTITVQDTVAPIISTLPAPSTVSCSETPVFATATASDACGSTVTLTFNDVTTNGQCAGSYSVTRTWTAVDACGNQSTASQTITVQDTVAPVISTLPTPSTVSCSETPVFATATASDACGSAVTLTFNDVTTNGQCAGSYSVNRTWTAVDACGNQSTASQTITVQDIVAPTITTQAADASVECDSTDTTSALNAWLANNGGAVANDTCSQVTWTNNFTSLSDGCGASGNATVTFTATDACGNQTTTAATFAIVDTTLPQLVTPLDTMLNVNCDVIPDFPVLTFTDNCSTASFTTDASYSEVTESGTYVIVRTWTVTDECNNQNTFTQTINVTIPNYFRTTTAKAVCNIDVDLTVNVATIINSQFPGVLSSNGTFTDLSNSGALTTDGIFKPLDLENGNYIVRYQNNDPDCPRIVEVTIPVDRNECIVLDCVTLEVHNALTPNGDGVNETLIIDNITDPCYSENTMEIFNRWGVLVFETTNYNNRDKVFKGISEGRDTVSQSAGLDEGVYFYILKYKTIEGNYATKNGYLYLSR